MNEETRKNFHQSAMRNGTILGAVWSIMYLLLFAGTTNMLALTLCMILYVASPFIAGGMAIKFRRNACNDRIGYLPAFSHLLYTYICATLLSTLAVYIYFAFFDNGAFFSTIYGMFDEIGKVADDALAQQIDQTRKIIDNTTTSSITWQLMNNNFVNTAIMPLVIAIFVKKTR